MELYVLRAARFLDVRSAALHWASLGILHIIVALISGGTRAAEETPAQEQEPSWAPPNVERSPQLPPLSVGQDGVVEIPNDGVGGPADGDEHHQARNDEGDPGRDGHFTLLPFVLHKVGALAPDHGEEDREDSNDDGYDHERSGSLQVLR